MFHSAVKLWHVSLICEILHSAVKLCYVSLSCEAVNSAVVCQFVTCIILFLISTCDILKATRFWYLFANPVSNCTKCDCLGLIVAGEIIQASTVYQMTNCVIYCCQYYSSWLCDSVPLIVCPWLYAPDCVPLIVFRCEYCLKCSCVFIYLHLKCSCAHAWFVPFCVGQKCDIHKYGEM